MTTEQENKLFAQVTNDKASCEFVIDDDQKRYQDSWLYHRKILPKNIEPGKKALDIVIPILQDTVNTLKPQISNIFTENDEQAVIFRDLGFQPNPIMTSLINEMINRIVLRENDGYRLIENAVQDALISGDAFIKIYMEEDLSRDKLKLDAFVALNDVLAEVGKDKWKLDLPEDAFDGRKRGKIKGVQFRTRMTKPGFNPDGSPAQPQPILEVMGTIPLIKNERKLRIRNVGMQDLIFDTTCGEEFDRCRYMCHKNTMTVGEAYAMGYDKAKIDASSTINRLGEASYSKVNLVNGNQISAEDYTQLEVVDPLERKITVDEHYAYSSILTNGKESELLQVITTDTAILDVKKVDIIPFVHMQMEIIPDSFFGGSLFDRCKMYQDALTLLARVGIKQQIKATYNKHIAWKGQYDRDALESDDPNVIIEIEQPGAVTPYVPPQLDQTYAEVLQFINSTMQNTVGSTVGNISTEEGVPANTAAATVAMILANEGLKSKVIAKTIARTGIKPMMEIIYKVMKQEGYIVQIPNPQNPQGYDVISADTWPDMYDFLVDIETERDAIAEQEQIAAALNSVIVMAQGLAQAPLAQSIITQQNLYNFGMKEGSRSGVDMTPYLSNPSQQQADPQQVAQAQWEQQKRMEYSELQIDELRQKINKLVAETDKLESETEEKVRNGVADREIKFDNSLKDIQKTQADAQNNAEKNRINEKFGDAEVQLNTLKHVNDTRALAQDMRHKEQQHVVDIATPQIDSGKRGVPNGIRS